jgi:hypothetical protein
MGPPRYPRLRALGGLILRRESRYLLLLLCATAATVLVASGAFADTSKPVGHKPTHKKLPSIAGLPQVGRVVHASRGRWNGASRFTYSWELCNAHGARCKPIANTAKRPKNKPLSYRISAADLGHTLRVTVVATNAWGRTSARSHATAVIGRFNAIFGPGSGGSGSASGTGSGGSPTQTTLTVPGTGQSVAFWLAWSGGIQESQIPWNDVTQVDLFALKTTDGTGLDTTSNGLSRMNVPAWTAMIHQHHRLAFVSIGGSNDENWVNACNTANIAGFTTNLVTYMVSNGFDGVDIDIESLNANSQSTWNTCIQAITLAAHAVKTQAGNTPIVSTDVDQSWMDPDVAGFYQWPDQFNLMYYGYPTGSYSCADNCASVDRLVQGLHNTGHVPYSKMVLGMSPGGGQAQCCYTDLATTSTAVSGTITSIPVGSISTAIPAGNIVLATTQNPPTNYQILTTPGVGTCSSNCSIPISGSPTANFSYASGSDVQSAYSGPWDCGNFARYAAANGLEGVMIWDLQEEAGEHNGQFPCFDQVGPYVAPPS